MLLVHVSIFGQVVDVLYFNDFHGMLRERKTDKSYYPGIAKFMTILKKEYEKSPESTILLSGGDNYQGDFLSSLSHGDPVNEMFHCLHVRLSAVGNHEFDWNSYFKDKGMSKNDYFKRWENAGGFHFLAANIRDAKTGQPVNWAKPYEIIKVNGIKIAFIGLSTIETAKTTSPENVKDIIFDDAAQVTQKWIDYLKEGKDSQGKPDVIIALTHIPSSQKDSNKISSDEIIRLCTQTKGLDAILSAHSHEIVSRIINNIPIVQAKSCGTGFAILRISADMQENKLQITIEKKLTFSEMPTSPDQQGLDILDKYEKKHKDFAKIIGYSQKDFINDKTRFSAIGKFATDEFQKAANVQIALMNNGGIRDNIYSGATMLGDIHSAFPFYNKIYTMDLKGSALMEALKNPQTISSGLTPKIKYKGEGRTLYDIVGAVMPDGNNIDNEDFYTVCINDFMLNGGDNYKFKEYERNGRTRSIKTTNLTYFDVLVKAVKEQKIITPCKSNFIVVPEDKKNSLIKTKTAFQSWGDLNHFNKVARGFYKN